MQEHDHKDIFILEKKMYHQLTEVMDITKQLAEAVDRQDQVSVRILLAMRQAPIFKLKELQSHLELKRYDLDGTDVQQYDALLAGADLSDTLEQPLVAQVATNRRLHQKLIELDRHVNQKLGGEHSYYAGK